VNLVFGEPVLAWALLGLAAIAVVRFLHRYYLNWRLAPIGASSPALREGHDVSLHFFRELLLWLGLALVVIAAMRPRGGEETVEKGSEGSNIVVVIDCSRSMDAGDVYPSRMEVAQRKATDLLRLGPGNRVALLPFAEIATLRCPLTGDASALEAMVEDCDTSLFPREFQGTSIGRAVQLASDVLGAGDSRGRAILVITDGDDPDRDEVEEAAKRARNAGIPVCALLVGDVGTEATITVDGATVAVPPESETVDHLASETRGIRETVTPDDSDLEEILAHLEKSVDKVRWRENRRIVASERYFWFALLGTLCFALGYVFPTAGRRKIR